MRTRAPSRRRVEPVIKDLFDSIAVDLFAGGGGASIGSEKATGHPVDIAVNHDAVAIAVHAANHPYTEHHTSDIFEVKPKAVVRGRHVRHLHASPDCRDFSRAKGGKPKSKSVRSLADVVITWAADARPDVITLENVCEFEDWGPLDENDKPIKARRGEYFKRWKGQLVALGYQVEHRALHAHHYGAPTSRKRFFLVARCDGERIAWPEATHGPGKEHPYRTAAECIDWSIPCPSIFERARPLADATLRRIAAGIFRFVLGTPDPFIVTIDNGSSRGSPQSVRDPLSTIIATNPRHAVVAPSVVTLRNNVAPRSPAEPLTTVSAGGTHHVLAQAGLAPFIAGCGGRAGQTPPTAGNQPVGTITAKNDRVVVAPTLIQTGYGERPGQAPRVLDLHQPLGTIVGAGQKHGLIAAFLAQHYGGQVGHDARKPLPTITAKDHHAAVSVQLASPEFAAQYPNARHVLPFLVAYYGSELELGGQDVGEPLRTITTKDRFALVCVEVDGKTFAIVDIGMRMLEPEELLRCQFGEFAEGYDLSPAVTKKDKVRLVGNSVCPHMQRAVVACNVRPWRLPGKRRGATRPRATPTRRAA